MGPGSHVKAPLRVKEVNWSRFTIGSSADGTQTGVRCTVCGVSWEFEVAALPELAHWAVAHNCPQPTVN